MRDWTTSMPKNALESTTKIPLHDPTGRRQDLVELQWKIMQHLGRLAIIIDSSDWLTIEKSQLTI